MRVCLKVSIKDVKTAFKREPPDAYTCSFTMCKSYEDIRVTLYMTAEMRSGPEDATLHVGDQDFEHRNVALGDRDFWGPISLPSWGTNNRFNCMTATHRYHWVGSFVTKVRHYS